MLALVCVAAYAASLGVGFLLDDFVHVDYASRAWQGDWGGFLHAFGGNWTGRTDNLTSYRPAISVSFLIDALIWQANAFGYHLTNVLMFFGCCVFVRTISLELGTLSELRFGRLTAFCAALLFALHPLHPESVAWIIGRVDVQCGLFYLAAVMAYLRGRRLRRARWLVVSLLAFLIALPSKEMAVTLPVVVALAEALLFFGKGGDKPRPYETSAKEGLLPGGDRSHPHETSVTEELRSESGQEPRRYLDSIMESIKWVLPFWALLGAYAVLRTALIGTLVGGYGGSFQECWRNFLDKATLYKIFFPANEEIGMPGGTKNLLIGFYAALAGIAGARLWARCLTWRALLFLGSWALVAVLPAFQIWHIYPNLVGSRLFFLPSAPFCIFLAFLAVPVAARASHWRWQSVIGGTILVAIAGAWAVLLQLNVEPYVVAGRRMANVREQVNAIAAETPAGERSLFLDLPQDYQGAGMIGRPEFLEMLVRPPVAAHDFTDRLLTIESPVPGSREYLYPEMLRRIVGHPRLHAVYQWDTAAGQFVPWRPAGGAGDFHFTAGQESATKVSWEPAAVHPVLSTNWSSTSLAVARVVVYPDHVTVYPGNTGATLILPELAIDPLAAQVVTARLRCTAGDTAGSAPQGLEKVRFIWTAANAGGAEQRSAAAFDEIKGGRAKIYIARYRSWSLGRKVTSAGLSFLPGDYKAEIYGIDVTGATGILPRLHLTGDSEDAGTGDPYRDWQLECKVGQPVFADCDVSTIPGATGARLLVTKVGKVFSGGAAPVHPSADELAEGAGFVFRSTTGLIRLPDRLVNEPGLRQLRVVAVNAKGESIGWPSDPQTLFVERVTCRE